MTRNQLLELFPLGPSAPDGTLHDPISAISGAIGIGGNLIGGLLGSSASGNAAKIQEQNAQNVAGMAESATQGAQAGMGAAVPIANNYLSGAGTTSAGVYSPYLQAGNQGVNSLASMMAPGGALTSQFSFNPSDAAQVAASPQYQFALQQGTAAVNQNAANSGLLNSGGTLKSLMSYGQGLASQQYQNAYNNALQTFQTNRQNTLQGLGMLTGIGQNAANSYTGQNLSLAQMMSGNTIGAAQYGGNVGLQGAQIAGSALTGGANAQAAGTVGQANAWSNALSGIGNTSMGVAQGYNLNQTLGQLGSYGGYNPGPLGYTGYGTQMSVS